MIWKTIPGFSNYEISEDGQIRQSTHIKPIWRSRWKPGHLLNPGKGKRYPYVFIRADDGKWYTKKIHKLVGLAFLGPQPADGYQINHKDDNGRNNHYSNLYWGTQVNNRADANRNGKDQYGENGPNSGFSNEKAREIKELRKTTGMPYDTIAKKYGVAYSTIRHICIGKTYKDV